MALVKIVRDELGVNFFVQTDQDLTPKTDPGWMRLFIDTDRNKSTGWEGYDLLVNRLSPTDSALVEKSDSTWNWHKVAMAAYKITGNVLEIKLNRSLFPRDSVLNFEFKWSDNMQEEGNIMDFYVNGDVAPGGRFNFVYNTENTVDIDQKKTFPKNFQLNQNYPNPFNSRTIISYQLPANSTVELNIFDIGRKKTSSIDNSIGDLFAVTSSPRLSPLVVNDQDYSDGFIYYLLFSFKKFLKITTTIGGANPGYYCNVTWQKLNQDITAWKDN